MNDAWQLAPTDSDSITSIIRSPRSSLLLDSHIKENYASATGPLVVHSSSFKRLEFAGTQN